ncbi:MAG: hypothetical protein F4Z75_09010 [Synechococcus sp. SB0668_bin_15]|nr:hypothetical protein [Synechococcus sp. SB0668_bin_15]MYC50621.1 hypothetical protein [Synechococcus sp. SB0662_bin_14]
MPSLGDVTHKWRQWLAPGVVVAAVLAMGSLQRADIREFTVDTRADIQEFRTAVRADFQGINDRIDRVNERMDQLDNRMNQVNIRMDRIYQLLLP